MTIIEHRDVACAIIFNSFGEILLQKKDLRYLSYPGIWSFFGGAVEKGETPKEAVIRELKEEIGINFEEIKLFNTCDCEDPHPQKILKGKMFTFIAQHNGTDIKLTEGAGFAFFSKEEILSLNMIPYTKEITLKFYEEARKCGNMNLFLERLK